MPADPLPPEPERFFGRERSFVSNYPSPHPQHLAEGLPDLCQWRPDGLVPIYLRYLDCIWCKKENGLYRLRLVQFKVHQKYNEVHFKRGWEGWDIFFLSSHTAIFKPTTFLEPVFQPAKISLCVWNRGDAIMHYMDTTTCNRFYWNKI